MATFLSDSFTDTDGVDLGSHVGETGATWTEHTSYTAGAHLIGTNRCYCSTATSAYHASGTPGGANYSVEALFFVRSTAGRQGIAGRMSTSADTFYIVDWAPGLNTLRLGKFVTGTFTQLGTATLTGVASDTKTITLKMIGTTIEALVDASSQISVTDSSISSAGQAGVRASTGVTSTTGPHLTSITAYDATQTIAVDQASETDSALDITVRKRYSLDLATETDSSFDITARKRYSLDIAVETDSAFDITEGGAPVTSVNYRGPLTLSVDEVGHTLSVDSADHTLSVDAIVHTVSVDEIEHSLEIDP